MTEERFKYYMDLFESAEKLKMENITGYDEYNYNCCAILEKMHNDYVKSILRKARFKDE